MKKLSRFVTEGALVLGALASLSGCVGINQDAFSGRWKAQPFYSHSFGDGDVMQTSYFGEKGLARNTLNYFYDDHLKPILHGLISCDVDEFKSGW
jgi:hypothetical protein